MILFDSLPPRTQFTIIIDSLYEPDFLWWYDGGNQGKKNNFSYDQNIEMLDKLGSYMFKIFFLIYFWLLEKNILGLIIDFQTFLKSGETESKFFSRVEKLCILTKFC